MNILFITFHHFGVMCVEWVMAQATHLSPRCNHSMYMQSYNTIHTSTGPIFPIQNTCRRISVGWRLESTVPSGKERHNIVTQGICPAIEILKNGKTSSVANLISDVNLYSSTVTPDWEGPGTDASCDIPRKISDASTG